jgi:hypothetical protein
MKQRLIATLLTLCLLVSMTAASAKSWSCESGTCVETNKPCGQLTDCANSSCGQVNCAGNSCGQADCVDCQQEGWLGKLIAVLAAIGITSLVINEVAGQ